MALSVGELVAYIKVDDKEFQGGLDRSESRFGRFTGVIGKAAVMAGVAAGAAVAGFAAYGVQQFAQFEKGMTEVFTLLPGISEQAMGQMMDDTRSFVREMGIAHDEAVPALYQAISAGVPKENVFDFMEVAAKAAIGGVTTLETAVDGITSTVNAYGEEAVSAQQASDLMFTAVRLGKTTFDELSNSLFQVNPVASALGVEFGDVTAALASMTAQGVPTSVATTQLRQAFVELSKSGGETATLFEKISGQTFKDFIASGGNTQTALQLLEQHAQDTGVGVNDLFGSVEAGAAALALTGKGTESFTGALAAMEESAGATDAAYATMDRGLSRSMERIKISFTDAAIGLGQTLAPALAAVADWVVANMPAIQANIETAIGVVTTVFGTAASILTTVVLPAFTSVIGFIRDNSTVFTVVAGIITAVFLPALVAMGLGAIASGVQVVAGWVMAQAAGIAALAVHSATIAATVAGWALMGAQSLLHAAKVAAAWLIAIGPIGLVIAAVVGLVVLVIKNWDTIRNATVAVWNAVAGAVSSAASAVASFVSGMVSSVLGFIGRLSALPGEAARHFGGMLTSAVSKAGELLAYVGGLPGQILSALGNLGSLLLSAGGNLIGGFISGIRSRAGDIIAAIRSTITDKLPGFVKSALGISSPSKVFAAIGADTGMGMVVGLQKVGPKINAAMADAIQVPAMPSLGGLNVPSYTRGDPTYGGAVQGRQAVFQIEKVVVGEGRTFAEEMALTEALHRPRIM